MNWAVINMQFCHFCLLKPMHHSPIKSENKFQFSVLMNWAVINMQFCHFCLLKSMNCSPIKSEMHSGSWVLWCAHTIHKCAAICGFLVNAADKLGCTKSGNFMLSENAEAPPWSIPRSKHCNPHLTK